MEPHLPETIREERPLEFINAYFRTLWTCLREPTRFFNEMPKNSSVPYALTFALVTHWIGQGLGFVWGRMNDLRIMELIHKLEELDTSGQLRSNLDLSKFQWFYGTTSVLLAPIFGLFMIFMMAVVIFIGMMIFVPRENENRRLADPSFEESLRLVSYSYAAEIFAGVPFVGKLLVWIFGFLLLYKGVKARFQLTQIRALLVASTPSLIVMFAVFAVVGTLLVPLWFMFSKLF